MTPTHSKNDQNYPSVNSFREIPIQNPTLYRFGPTFFVKIQQMTDKQLEEPLIPPEKSEEPERIPEPAQPSPEKVEEGPPPKPITFFQMFRFADSSDIALMVLGSLTAMGAGAVMPFFSFLFGDVTLIYLDPDPIKKALEIAIKFWLLGVAAWVLSFLSVYCWVMSGERQSLRYRKIYYKLLLRQQVHWYDITNPNELATRVTTQITAIQGAIGQKIATLCTVAVMSTLGFFLAYFRNWRLSLVLSATLPLLMLAGFLVMKAMTKVGEKNTKTYSKAGAVAEQAISAIRTVKALVGEGYEVEKYVEELNKTKSDAWKYTTFVAASLGFMILVFLSCYGLGFWYGKIIIIDYGYNISDVISTFFCIIMGGGSIGQMAPAIKNIALGKAAIAKVFQLIDRQPTIKEPQNGVKLQRINHITFQNTEFAYPKNPDLKVLKSINITIPQNKTTALVGESGSGKSTIVQLVQRFYDPTSGQVLVNGTPLTQLDLETYRQKIGYVGQQPAMFAMSIKENLLFAKEDATEEEIMEALKQANADEFVSKMEKGIDTFLGAGGAQISGGQKQRIAIARAILKNPSLFIFDEATSALDRKNEKLIQQTLSNLSKNRTTLVIAHRLSSIQKADNIIVVNRGSIVEQGTHEELLAAKSYYYDLIKNQIQAEEKHPQAEQEIAEIAQSLQKNESVLHETGAVEENKAQKEQRQGKVFSKLIAQSAPMKANYLLGAFCAILNGVTFPAFSYVLSNLMAIMAQLNNPYFDQQQTKKDIDIYCLGFLLAACLGGITTFGFHLLFGRVGDNLVYQLRTKAFSKLVRLPVSYFDKPDNNPGAISAKLAQDAYLIHNMTTGALSVLILNLATVGAGLTLAFYYNWRLSLVVLGLSPFMTIAGSINMKRMKRFAEQTDQAYKQAGNQISDTVCNIRTVKSFGNTMGLIRAYNRKLEVPYKIALKKAITSGFFQGLGQGIVLGVYGLVFYLAAVLKVKVYDSSPADIFISIFAIVFAAVGMGNNSALMPDMAKAKNAGANIFEIIESQDEHQSAIASGGVDTTPIQGNIEFRQVYFKYPSRVKSVFKNLNFTVTAGQKVGLVGSSGCGKSTILQLVLRFYEIDQGTILIDGRNIKDYDLYHLRSNFGVVTQQPVLFAGTIQQNIRYKHTTTSFQQVKQAAQIANAKKFIQDTQAGYDKQVGTKGVQISGGQKQRIAIARCALSHPNIYFFDEATSALDVTTEKLVFQSLNKLSEGKTTLSIAHRISTIADANKIIVFDSGKIVEEGTYQELNEQKGYFYRLERGQN